MRITDVEVIPYRIPYRKAHSIATLTLTGLENLLIRIHTDEGKDGFGEVVSEAKWNSTVLGAHEIIVRDYLAPAIIGLDPLNVNAVWAAMDKAVNAQYSAKAGIDQALHDLIGKILDMPVRKYLGGALTDTIEVEGVGFGIGFMEADEAAALAEAGISEGCRQIEIKCGHPAGWEHDVEVVAAVRKVCGPDVSLKIDVTEAYSYKTALTVLPRFADLGVEWVEQPLEHHQLEDLARLREVTPVKIVLEESIAHPADVIRVASMGAADAIHVKLPMLGGFTMCRKVATICEAAGLGVLPGSSTPSGVGLAAVHQFAATLRNAVRGCHGSPLARTVDDIVVDPVSAYAARVELNDKPGLGVELDLDMLDRYRVRAQ